MKFKKRDLINLAENDRAPNFTLIRRELIDTTRWSIVNSCVFEFEGKLYCTTYSYGATECQDESPYEYDDDEIECDEVFALEVTVTKYLTQTEINNHKQD